ncbi:MAG: hypothetical protein HN377_02635 [Alphaproteobacteria bacterium]|jgi:hypothetical protein|nr:hypothetical protein [Alphaproteobacteria bacterium]
MDGAVCVFVAVFGLQKKDQKLNFPRSIRLDVSDANAFPIAANDGEWSVTGTFAFADTDPEGLTNKEQLAFRNGWLGTDSFGRTTFVQVAEISDEHLESVVSNLAGHLMDHYGAPDMAAATQAARGEAEYTAELCDHPVGTLLGIEREFTTEGVAERIRLIPKQVDAPHAKIWSIEEDGGNG